MRQILLVFLLVFSIKTCAQQQISVQSGVNFSNFHGDASPRWDRRIGLGEAIRCSFFYSESAYLEAGLSYDQRGTIYKIRYTDDNGSLIKDVSAKTNYDYIGITARWGFRTSGKVRFGMFLGAAQSVLLNAKLKLPISEVNRADYPENEIKDGVWIKDLSEPSTKLDFGLQVGCDIGLGLNKMMDLFFEISAYQGITKFNYSPYEPSENQVGNLSILVGLGLRFDLGAGDSKPSE